MPRSGVYIFELQLTLGKGVTSRIIKMNSMYVASLIKENRIDHNFHLFDTIVSSCRIMISWLDVTFWERKIVFLKINWSFNMDLGNLVFN